MKEAIVDIREITNSREMYEAKPRPFASTFIYILLSILLCTLTWTYFGEIDTYVKANGVVRPEETVSTIINKMSGKLEAIYYEEGKVVKKGDVLFTIDHSQLLLQKESIKEQLQLITQEFHNLKKLKQSIVDGRNYFNVEIETEQDYYNKYKQYETTMEIELRNSELTNQQLITTREELENLTKLKESILKGENLISETNSEYYIRYEDYNYNIESFKRVIEKTEETYKTQKILETVGAVSTQEYKDAKRQFENAEQDLDMYKNGKLLEIDSAIEQSKKRLKELELTTSNINGQNLGLSSQKYKIDTLVQIDKGIKSYQTKIDSLEKELEKIELSIADGIVTAPRDGKVNINMEITKGDFIQSGTHILNIVPKTDSKYRIQLYVSNKDIANIKEGDKVKYHFLALSYREYGELIGEITRISTDATANNEGGGYYLVEASVENRPLYSYKGDKAELKVGMISEAQVVLESKKILYFLLEKINLRD